jgi:hypothetical protein
MVVPLCVHRECDISIFKKADVFGFMIYIEGRNLCIYWSMFLMSVSKGSDTSANKLIQKTLIIIDSNGKIASNKYHVKSKM